MSFKKKKKKWVLKNVGDAVTKVGIILETLEFDMKEQRYKK